MPSPLGPIREIADAAGDAAPDSATRSAERQFGEAQAAHSRDISESSAGSSGYESDWSRPNRQSNMNSSSSSGYRSDVSNTRSAGDPANRHTPFREPRFQYPGAGVESGGESSRSLDEYPRYKISGRKGAGDFSVPPTASYLDGANARERRFTRTDSDSSRDFDMDASARSLLPARDNMVQQFVDGRYGRRLEMEKDGKPYDETKLRKRAGKAADVMMTGNPRKAGRIIRNDMLPSIPRPDMEKSPFRKNDQGGKR
jgi:hypothetical protein